MMEPKICLVTGANSGIGFATAEGLAKQGAHVVLVSRDAKRGEDARQEITSRTGNSAIDVLVGDLSSFADIRQLAEQVGERYGRLDVLINNAGGVFSQKQLSQDGYEMTFAVNYLAPFLLTHLLLDSLKASGAGRIINVASRMQTNQLRLEVLPKQDAGRYSGMNVYKQAKTALLMLTYFLAKQLPKNEVTVNALHPGVIYTPQSARSAPSFVRPLMKLVMQSPEQGAATSLYLATSPEVSQITGNYYTGLQPVRTVPISYDAALQQQLYEQSLIWTGLS